MKRFRGHSVRNLDPKGRLMIPTEFRDAAASMGSDGVLMLTNFEGCVYGYPTPEWERIEESFYSIDVLDQRLRHFQRHFLSGAVEVSFDKQGRVLIPAYLRDYAGLTKDVVVAGVGKRLEIWDQEKFEALRQKTEENFDKDMAELAERGIQLRL